MKRLIEEWLPIAALGEESVRERRSMTALPPTYYLHVWWARRPLVASRAAILASILPHDTDRDRFMHILGIHGDPVASRRRIDLARRMGERFEGEAYTYKRAFTYNPNEGERAWIKAETRRAGLNGIIALDPPAGGGSIPFEMRRLGLAACANDLNPVAALILRATVEWPFEHGLALLEEFRTLADEFVRRREDRLAALFPREPDENAIPTNLLWARTITCPHCDGLIPLAPNWRLAPDGTGVRLHPCTGPGERRCTLEIVKSAKQQSEGTVAGGKAVCPFPDCGRVIDGDTIKAEAQARRMGDQLFAIVFKRRTIVRTGTGRVREKWIRGYRAPRPEDNVADLVTEWLTERLPEWEALDLVPTEAVPEDINDTRPIQYGMPRWRDLFNARQLYGHVVSVEIFRELLAGTQQADELSDAKRAAFGYLALSLDKYLNYNSRMSVWMPTREITANTFNRHDFRSVDPTLRCRHCSLRKVVIGHWNRSINALEN
jgi:adenine-specific DNA methylase